LIDDVETLLTPWWKGEGDVIVLLGRTREELGGSEYLSVIHGTVRGAPPWIDLDTEKRLHRVVLEAAQERLLRSAKDVGEGGLAGGGGGGPGGGAGGVRLRRPGAGSPRHAGGRHPARRAALRREPVPHGALAPTTLPGAAPRARPPRRRAAARARRGPGSRPRDRRSGGALGRIGARTLAARARAPHRRLREAPCTPRARSGTLPEPAPMWDKFHEECGVVGVYGHPEAATLAYLSLYALQHRGQESAGIVASNGEALIAHR